MSENQEIEYKDQKPVIDFKLQAYRKETELRFAHLINSVAENSPTGRGVLENAANEGYQLQMMLMSGMNGFVCPENKTVYLNPSCNDGNLIETLVHECRHIQQHSKGMPSSHHEFVLRDAVKLSRAKEADAETIGAAACYEIMINGKDIGPWETVKERTPKIAESMMAAAEYEGTPLTMKMLQGAFDGWYKNPEIMNVYEDSFIMTQCLGNSLTTTREAKTSDYFNREMTSKDMVNAFCTDAAGKCYWADRPDVLDEPERLQVREKVIKSAENVNLYREKELGLKRDDSYRDLFIYGQTPKTAVALTEKTSDKAVLTAVAARQKRSR